MMGEKSTPPPFRIRPLNRASAGERELVAERMRQTLIDVLGEERGRALYSLDWLRARVAWHLEPGRVSEIWLAEGSSIIGQAIARIDSGEDGDFCYFATIYVEPAARGQGIAAAFLGEVEGWARRLRLPKIIYNTAENNAHVIKLFCERGYRITLRADEMVQMTKDIR